VLATPPTTVARPRRPDAAGADHEGDVDVRLVLATANPDKAAELKAVLEEELDI